VPVTVPAMAHARLSSPTRSGFFPDDYFMDRLVDAALPR
jgi:hypothetical protein